MEQSCLPHVKEMESLLEFLAMEAKIIKSQIGENGCVHNRSVKGCACRGMVNYILARDHGWLIVAFRRGYGSLSLGSERTCHRNFVGGAVCGLGW